MSQDKENVPKLRFPGFTDAWEQRKLGEITDVRDGTHDSPQYLLGGHPFVTSKNVKDGHINYDDIQYISDVDFDEINKRSKVDINDILVGMIGTIGNTALVREKPDFAIKNVALIKDIKSVYYLYLYYYLQSASILKQLAEGMNGGTQKFIALNKIRNLLIAIPSKEEQNKIGNYIENLDHLITLHQRKLNNVQNLKAGLLQKMFPKNCEDFPEVRFPGFNDAWEQWKIFDFSEETYGGGTPKTSKKVYWEGEIPWIQSSDLTEHEVFGVEPKKRISQLGLKNSATKLVPAKSIAIITRVGVGKLAFMPFEYATSQDFLSLSKLKIDGRFAAYSLYKKLQSESCAVQGTSIKGITKDELLSKSVMVPVSNVEQGRIGGLFSDLDHLITLHQRKLKHLQEQKKSLLQQMFV